MSVTPVTLNVTVATAGTNVAATSSTSILPSAIIFYAKNTNAGDIFVGASNVNSAFHMFKLSAGASFTMPVIMSGQHRVGGSAYHLSNFVLDASANACTCFVTYMFNQG